MICGLSVVKHNTYVYARQNVWLIALFTQRRNWLVPRQAYREFTTSPAFGVNICDNASNEIQTRNSFGEPRLLTTDVCGSLWIISSVPHDTGTSFSLHLPLSQWINWTLTSILAVIEPNHKELYSYFCKFMSTASLESAVNYTSIRISQNSFSKNQYNIN